jgi:hypothetical protein
MTKIRENLFCAYVIFKKSWFKVWHFLNPFVIFQNFDMKNKYLLKKFNIFKKIK